MLPQLKKLLTPRAHSEEDVALTTAQLTIMVAGLGGGTLLFGALLVLFDATPSVAARQLTIGLTVFATLSAVALLLLTRAGNTRLASSLLLVVLWLGVTVAAYELGGLEVIATAGYFLLITSAAMLFGVRETIAAAVASVAALAFLALIASRSPENTLSASTLGFRFAVMSTFIVLITQMLVLLVGGLRTAARTAQQELVERRRAEQAEREQRELAEALRDTAAALSGTLKLDEVLERVLDNLERVAPYSGATVLMLQNQTARIAGARGYSDEAMEGLATYEFSLEQLANLRHMAESHRPIVIHDTAADPDWIQLPHTAWIRSFAGAPIIVENTVMGFIDVVSDEPVYSQVHAERLQVFANQAAIAIQNARLYEELENYSTILAQAVKEATTELAQAMERMEAVVQNSPDAILLYDAETRIETANPAFFATFGYTRSELGDLSPGMLARTEDAVQFATALRTTLAEDKPGRVEFTARRKDRTTFDADAVIAPIPGPDGPRGAVCSVRDISVLKNVERMKDSFISTAAHELRTPLTSILGFSEILLYRSLTDARREHYLLTIYRQAAHLAQIIDEMLDISRLEAGRGLQLRQEPVDLVELIEDAIQSFQGTMPRHPITFTPEPDLPSVPGDPFRLSQVVRNLISNAIKYSPEGGPVAIKARHAGARVEISVRDRGVGIPPEQQPHVYEKFYRIEAPNTAIPGTGLGLSIARLITEAHGGTIQLESQVGVGSTFTVSLPTSRHEVPAGEEDVEAGA